MEPYFRPNLWKSAFERVKRKSLYIFIISEEIIEFPIHKNGGSSILDPEECGNREKADGFCGAERDDRVYPDETVSARKRSLRE